MPLTFFSVLLIYIDIKKKNDKKGANKNYRKNGSRKGEVNSKKDNPEDVILNRFTSEHKKSTVLPI